MRENHPLRRPGWKTPLLTALACSLAISCGGEAPCLDEGATRVRFDPSASARSDWLAHPFPSDHRRTERGISWEGFPNPGGAELIENYLDEASDLLDGFGLNTPVYVSFDGPIDAGSLPEDPAEYMSREAPLQLVDVDPSSPELGRRFPLRLRYNDEACSFLPAHTLAAAPLWGFPLREDTRYALVVTGDIIDAAGLPVAPDRLAGLVLCGDDRCSPDYAEGVVESAMRRLAPVVDLFESEGVDRSHLVAATVFTTQKATADVRAMREVIHSMPAPTTGPWRVFESGFTWRRYQYTWAPHREASYYVLEGSFEAPYFIEGRIPYYTPEDGGGILLENGRPAVARMETLRFALTVPTTPPRVDGCHPIVQYAHGTGGQAHHFTYTTGGRLAGRGLAGIGLDQPLHGERNDGRSYDVSLVTFNVANIRSTRSLFRQSAADTFSLTRLLRNGFEIPAEVSPTGEPICFQPEPGLFFGHSQGGITGSIAAAYETDLDAWMLSGSGGGVGITVTERKDPVDLSALLSFLGGMEEDEHLDDLHPLVMLLHTLTEVTDPINYSPSWLARDEPRHFLVTSGCEDAATPYKTALAKSSAAGIPLIRPEGTESIAHEIAGLDPRRAPVSGNVEGSTVGHIHWPGADHFVVFTDREAINASMRFLESASRGGAVIERDPNAAVW